VEFLDARCPSCGGELKVPENKATIICMYCGASILVRDAIGKNNGVSLTNLILLAEKAANANNEQEAYDYYTRILEIEPTNSKAWYGKGLAAAWLSNLTHFRFDEFLNCINNSLEYSADDGKEEIKSRVVLDIYEIGKACFNLSKQHLENFKSSIISLKIHNEYLNRCINIISFEEKAEEYGTPNTSALKLIIDICNEILLYIKDEFKQTYLYMIENYIVAIKKQEPNYEPEMKLDNKLQEHIICPLEFISLNITHDVIGTPVANLCVKNTTKIIIDSFKWTGECYNSFGEPVVSLDSNIFLGLAQNETIYPKKKWYGYWSLYTYNNTSQIKNIIISSVVFKDGTNWNR
jgi:tetratricopeptide (TPR) repeat protein